MATLNPVPLPVTEADGVNIALGATTDAAVTNPASAASGIALLKGWITVLTGGTAKAITRGGAKGSTTAADITSTASGANHNAQDVILYDASGNVIAPALDATLTGGTVKAIARGGAKGATTAADITSTASGANHNAQDVILYDAAGNPYVFPAALGQGTMAQGFRVVLPTDQSSIPVAATLQAGTAAIGTANITGKNTELSGTAGSLNADAVASTDVSGFAVGILQVTGAFVGTITVASSNDNSTFVTQTIRPLGTVAATDATNLTATGMWVFPKMGKFVRVRMTSYTSGTATVTLEMANDAAPYSAQAVYSNLALMSGSFIATNNGTASTGTQRVAVAADNTPFGVSLAASTANGTSSFSLVAANSTNATSVKGSAGTVSNIVVSNNSATVAYVKLYDKATAPTVGTDTPTGRYMIPANTTIPIPIVPAKAFTLGIGLAVTSLIADSDTTVVAASTYIVNLDYK